MTTTGAPGFQRFLALAPEELELLRERARSLAALGTAAGSEEEQVELLLVQSRGQTFALPLSAVEGVTELTSVAALPRAPAAVRGLVNFRGDVLVAVELSVLVGGGSGGIADLRRVVALASKGRKLALLTEGLLTVRSAPVRTFKPVSGARFPFVLGADEALVSLLDPAGLVSHAFEMLEQEGA